MENNFERCTLVKEIEVPNKQMIVNGVPIKMKSTVICCPECGRVIYELGNNVPITMAYIWINDNRESLLKNSRYCPSCGTKLTYTEIIECDSEVIN